MRDYEINKAMSRILANAEGRYQPGFRWGQCVSNAVGNLQPHIAEQLIPGDLDPYYHSNRVGPFLQEVRKRLQDA